MTKASETQANMKKVQEALDKAILDKQNAETEAAMLKEKAESYQEEIKQLKLMVSATMIFGSLKLKMILV